MTPSDDMRVLIMILDTLLSEVGLNHPGETPYVITPRLGLAGVFVTSSTDDT